MLADTPELVPGAAELSVEKWVLEADDVVVAPLLEAVKVDECDRLSGVNSSPGNLLALDIQASLDALEVELDKPLLAMRTE
jgi:hypothetical protein